MAISEASLWPLGYAPRNPGPVSLPNGRFVYWTGRVAIGLRHASKPDHTRPVSQSQLWVQEQLLEHGRKR